MTFCTAEAQAFVQCRAFDSTGKCASCDPINFETIQTTFPEDLQQKFMMTFAYTSPGKPNFCPMVKDRICADNFTFNTCCCAAELAVWQACLVEKDFSNSIGQTDPCTFSCALPKPAGGGGASIVTIVTVVLLVLAAGGGLWGYIFIRKRCDNASGKNVDSSGDDTDSTSLSTLEQ